MPKPNKGGGNTGTISGNKRDNTLNGTENADVINGKGGNDTLFGLGGADTLLGGSGNDTLDGGLGNDAVDGGDGADTAILSGNRDAYVVTELAGGVIQISGPDGTDTFENVEFFQFADVTQTAAEVVVPLQANLSVDTLSLDDVVLSPGEGATASFTLVSNGAIDAGQTSYELLIATAPDEGSVVSVADTQTAASLATGGSASLTASIPADSLAPGTYWVAVRVDSADQLDEESEADNLTEWVQITVEAPVADLRLNAATLGDQTDLDLAGGGRLQMTYDIEDAGNISPSYFKITTYLSTDEQASTDDQTILGMTGGTYPGHAITPTTSHYFSEDFAAVDYYLISVISWGDGTADTNPGDNTVIQQITFIPPDVDLALTAAALDVGSDLLIDEDGVTLSFDVDVSNLGDMSATSNITAYLSTDGTISADDIQFSAGSVTLAAGDSGSVSVEETLMDALTAGDYQLILSLEGDDDLANNEISVAVTLEEPSGPNEVIGTESADTLSGTEGDDLITALGGDDLIFATDGADTVDGGEGYDTVDLSSSLTGVSILWDEYTGDGNLVLLDPETNEVTQTFHNVEMVIGTAQDDVVRLWWGDGLEVELGDGNDLASGTLMNDVIDMGAGDDLVAGELGDDIITLGEGFDMVGFARVEDNGATTGHGNDVITDFDLAEDLILLQGTDITSYDPLADLSQTAEGALLSYADDSSILFLGVDAASLTMDHFYLEDPIVVGTG